jgi:hypothetical protein
MQVGKKYPSLFAWSRMGRYSEGLSQRDLQGQWLYPAGLGLHIALSFPSASMMAINEQIL